MRYELAFCSFDYDFERKWSSLQRVNLPGAGSSVIPLHLLQIGGCAVFFIACRLFSRGVIFTRSRFARSTIPDEKWGTTRSLFFLTQYALNLLSKASSSKYVEWHSKGIPNRFLAGFVSREWLIDPNPKF